MVHPPHLYILTTQVSSLERERGVHLEEKKYFILFLGSYTVLGWILCRGSFVGFSPPWGFPGINLYMFFCVDVIAFISVILFLWLWCYDAQCFNILYNHKNYNMVLDPPWNNYLCIQNTATVLANRDQGFKLENRRRTNLVILEF